MYVTLVKTCHIVIFKSKNIKKIAKLNNFKMKGTIPCLDKNDILK